MDFGASKIPAEMIREGAFVGTFLATFVETFLATLVKLVAILKLGLRSISKRITSLTFLNIYTLPKHAWTRIILFVLK